ncbi:hypothetical protein NP590_11260 [Methylomonas sp. SURF-2]|uniref:Uncharacterized protein n=1 Tax=Methylomonas subterranea TaxID=2952225 RepID=A0ABT1TGX0_9GAMM|nr:hypothetical protein [Methylomonas sp. SURF-2]MCQ8104685.1 hypothetical protein [Methylomonas sp. SURF-2]
MTICIGENPKYCAPIADCQKSSDICSNNASDIAANNALQPIVTPAKKAEAEASAQTANNAKTDAETAQAAKEAASAAAQQNNAAAQSAATANPTVESLAAAASAAAQAASAAAQAANAAASAASAAGHAGDAAGYRDEITPDYPPGRATNAAGRAAASAGLAVGDSLRAIQGQAPDGSSSAGQDMGTCPGCAQESTLQSFKAGTANTINHGTPGGFDDSLIDSETQAAKSAYADKVNQIKTQASQLLNLELSGTGALPVFDFGEIKGVHVVSDLSRFTDLISIGNLILFIAGFIAVRIILDI